MEVSLPAGLLLGEDFRGEQAAIRRGYRDDPFSQACASRIFSSIEKRCRFSSRGTCTNQIWDRPRLHVKTCWPVTLPEIGCKDPR